MRVVVFMRQLVLLSTVTVMYLLGSMGDLSLEIARSGASQDVMAASVEIQCGVCREALMDVWQKASFGVLDTVKLIEDDISSHCTIKAWASQYTLSGVSGAYVIKNRSSQDYRCLSNLSVYIILTYSTHSGLKSFSIRDEQKEKEIAMAAAAAAEEGEDGDWGENSESEGSPGQMASTVPVNSDRTWRTLAIQQVAVARYLSEWRTDF